MPKFREMLGGKPKAPTALQRQLDVNTMLLGGLHAARVRDLPIVTSLPETEFKVFSQAGEDGIIQYLVTHVPIANRTFIEFGVESYVESNTRFLLRHNNWKGLVIDGSEDHIRTIKQDRQTYARHDLTAQCAFITRENINDLFVKSGFTGDIGLLSVDVDGNDYWLWEAVEAVSPRIVVCEYNAVFGEDAAITVPYAPAFSRQSAHYSCLYFGASLSALRYLAKKKGYDFVGCNSFGSNAFFVRSDLGHSLHVPGPQEGFVASTHRMDSRDEKGNLTRIGGAARAALISDMPVVDVRTGETMRLGSVLKGS